MYDARTSALWSSSPWEHHPVHISAGSRSHGSLTSQRWCTRRRGVVSVWLGRWVRIVEVFTSKEHRTGFFPSEDAEFLVVGALAEHEEGDEDSEERDTADGATSDDGSGLRGGGAAGRFRGEGGGNGGGDRSFYPADIGDNGTRDGSLSAAATTTCVRLFRGGWR